MSGPRRVWAVSLVPPVVAVGLGLHWLEQLPARVAVHFDWRGEADGWLGATAAVWAMPALSVVVLACLWGTELRRQREARRRSTPPEVASDAAREPMAWVALWGSTFLALLQVLLLEAARRGVNPSMPRLLGLVGAMVLLLGLLLPRLSRNLLVGVRTPWSMSSPEVWARTQRLAGLMFAGSGALTVAAAWLAPSQVGLVLVSTLLTAAVVASVQSLRWSRLER